MLSPEPTHTSRGCGPRMGALITFTLFKTIDVIPGRPSTTVEGRPFVDAKKAGPNANTNATIFPGLRKCFHICPGLIELKVEKKRQGVSPPESYSAPGLSASAECAVIAEMSGGRPIIVGFMNRSEAGLVLF